MGKANTYLTGKPWMKTLTPGDAYTNLTVVRFVGMREVGQRKRQVYLFRCLCGKEVEFLGTDVYRERIKSCGCTHDCGYEESAFRAIRLAYSSNAVARGLGFNLTDEQLKTLFAGNCHYCGEPPSNLSRKKRKLNYAVFKYNGIDRVNNSVGYTIDNVVPCCRTCNWMKQKMSPEEFVSHCRRVVNFTSKGEQHFG
jgi:hypothetical protein